ncbi:hypothetical protein KJ656_11910 [bacterium]|nr:hypothetical protein [bacterium]
MTVEAKDLTGNSILALNQDQTTINPATQLTRNAEGTMQGIGGSDTQEITMKKIILSTAILLGVTNFAMAENNGIDRSTETQEMENYTSEVLIVGKWGRGDKEFGLTKREDGPDVGPNAIAVDKAENLYILDPANKRIVVYKKNGKYLNSISLESLKQYQLYSSLGNSFAVDSSGNIFIFTQNRDFYYGSVVVKIDRQGKILRQYASLAPLKENFDPSSSKFLERFNKIKKAPEMNIFPETVGKLMGPVVDNDGNVYAMAEQGILIPLSQEINMKITSYPGHPMENRKNYIVRDPKVPLTKYLPKKPALIKNLFVKTAKGKIIATINANDIQKYLPTAAKIDGIHYKRSDIFGNKFFLIWTEDIGNRCFVIRFDPNWRPTVLTAIQNVSYHPFVISHDGNILQLVWDSAKIDDGVKILKWMVKP